MYGYFRPFESKLSVGERKLFHSYYCRLCYCLRVVGGQKSRCLTMFDTAIYSILYAIATGEQRPPFLSCERIGKKNMNLFLDDEVGKRFAYLSLIAIGEKVHDDEVDGKKGRAFWLSLLFKKQIKLAQDALPEVAKISRQTTDEISALQDGGAGLFAVLDAYGEMGAGIFKAFGVTDERFLQVYRSIFKWTFFVDMLCDYEDDFKEKAYNAFFDKDCPTIKAVFEKNFAFILDANTKISNDIISSLKAINDGSMEWKIIYRVMEYSLNTVAFNVLEDKDVKFHYFKELKKNWKLGRGENKSNFS